MLKNFLLVFISTFSFFIYTNANATLDRTYVTVTNNTNQAISIRSTIKTDDGNFIKGTHWEEYSLQLEPYQSKEVMWFNRNIGVKINHDYLFTLTASHSDFINENVVFNFLEKGRSVYGSELTTDLQLANEKSQSVLVNNGLFQFPATIWNGNFVIHARKWKPLGILFENYHIVIDQAETNTIPTPKNTQLSVLTYNTQLMPFYTGAVNDLNQPERREHDIAKNISGYDVVIMEELFDHDLRIMMSNDMEKNYPYRTTVVGHDTSLPLTGGVIIYSKWPIINEDQLVYVANAGIDVLAAKGIAYAAINKNGKIYHIFGTHTVAGDSNNTVISRTAELAEFDNFILRKHIPANEAIIIGGDMNIDQFGNEIQSMHSILRVSPLDNIGYKYTNDALVNLMTNGHDRKRLDYIFYRNTHAKPKIAYNKVFVLRALDDEEKWPKFDLSDHFPVVGYFDFSDGDAN